MLRTNLSTRPFYNERAVHLALISVALIAVVATVFNVTRVIQLSRRDTTLSLQASRDESRAAELTASATRLRATVDPRAIDLASTDAREANDLIDRRTFSWTELFNRFETTLPDDVRITTVTPQLDPKRGIVLTIVVVARAVDDVNQFIENLEGTGAFLNPLARENRVDEQGEVQASIEAIYKPAAAHRPEGAER
jgi:Tfp pilus assembly protein PilN